MSKTSSAQKITHNEVENQEINDIRPVNMHIQRLSHKNVLVNEGTQTENKGGKKV